MISKRSILGLYLLISVQSTFAQAGLESMNSNLSTDTDVPFVFDTAKAHYGAPLPEADEKVAQEMNMYWANLIKTGNPSGAGLPDWPAYHSTSDMLMDFTENGPVAKAHPWRKRLDLTEELASKRASQ